MEIVPIVAFKGDFRFLSNFYPSEIYYEENYYPTIEHAYQAMKTLHEVERKVIRELKTPGEAKRYGAKIRLRPDWEDVKYNIMRDLLVRKFCQKDLGKKLLATGERQLIEGNTWGDTYWGVCEGKGQNNLGILLMEVRDLCKKYEGLWRVTDK